MAPSRTAAQRALEEGRVRVGGVPTPKASTLVDESASIAMEAPGAQYVSRGGLKLAGALDDLGLPVAGRRALDAGAATGGFTDCLLQRGASEVVAVDVGYGQLAWELRRDPRVTVVERTNVRHADPHALGAPFDVIVADLSFISLGTVAGALARLGGPGTDYVLLVKPQFEVGKGKVGKGGLVKEPALHAEALQSVAAALDGSGLGVMTALASAIEGATGNREFFVHARPGRRRASDADLARVAGA